MKNGTIVRVLEGASDWMKKRNYWLENYGESIDGKYGTITADYTNFLGDDSHFVLDIGVGTYVGVNPMWLIPVNYERHEASL